MLAESYYSEEVRPILTSRDGSAATQAAMARTGWIRSGGEQTADNVAPSEFPNIAVEGAGTAGITAQATAAEATAVPRASTSVESSGNIASRAAADSAITPASTTAAATDEGFVTAGLDNLTIPPPSEIGLSNNTGIMSAADIIAAITPGPKVSGSLSDLAVSNPVGAPEAAAPSLAQLTEVGEATASIRSNSGQGTGTIVNYNGSDYLVTDGHVTGTNPNGIADGTNTAPATSLTAITAGKTVLDLGPAIADPTNDLVAYKITGADGAYKSIQLGDDLAATPGETVYSVNYGNGKLQADAGTNMGQMPNIYFFPDGRTPDTGRNVANTDMPAAPGASGAGAITFDQNGQPVYRGTLANGYGNATGISFDENGHPPSSITSDENGRPVYRGNPDFANLNSTQFTNVSALKNLLDSAESSAKPAPAAEAPAPAADAPAPAAEAPAPAAEAPAPAADAPAPAADAPAPAADAPAPAADAPAPAADAPAPAADAPAPAADAPAPAADAPAPEGDSLLPADYFTPARAVSDLYGDVPTTLTDGDMTPPSPTINIPSESNVTPTASDTTNTAASSAVAADTSGTATLADTAAATSGTAAGDYATDFGTMLGDLDFSDLASIDDLGAAFFS